MCVSGSGTLPWLLHSSRTCVAGLKPEYPRGAIQLISGRIFQVPTATDLHFNV